MYHPPYYATYHGGMYGAHIPTYVKNTNVNVNVNNSNNIYNKQKGATTNNVNRGNNNNV
ncbi:MAG: hypothetical protein H7259_10250 [Cytophagales bacterium]|nr:hypothetical protein [Cytophaga sp.]